ncbi:MAG TPA: CHRD domain-containing protein [Dissulfurispiraceae bacterium]|nr:CHRD domain-containing protein [Dissulfurispiraceae bacterium]
MKTILSLMSIVLITVVLATSAGATLITLDTMLTPVSGTGSAASGTFTGTFDTVADTLAFSMAWTGLTTNLINAHIHLAPTIGANGPVLIPFFAPGGVETITPTPPTLPLGVSGTLTESILITDATTLSEFLTGLSAGTLYVNLHTVNFPGGEIRGNFSPVASTVPEPGTLILLAGGIAACIGASRFRKLS